MKLKLAALSKDLSPLHLSTSANEPACRITVALGGKRSLVGRRKWILPLKASGLMSRRWAEKERSGQDDRRCERGDPETGRLTMAISAINGNPRRMVAGPTSWTSRYSMPGSTGSGGNGERTEDPYRAGFPISQLAIFRIPVSPHSGSFELSQGKQLLGFS